MALSEPNMYQKFTKSIKLDKASGGILIQFLLNKIPFSGRNTNFKKEFLV